VTAYYNEIDEYAAAWLRNLIAAGHIAPGEVDTRSIEDVHPADLQDFTQCHFFAGIGGWPLALRLAGWPDGRLVWTGSCPCQPFSSAGKGVGFADERHLWPAFHHLISERKPTTVLGEQVASPDGLVWLDQVQADLEASGYAIGAADLCAAGVGADHIRQRLYWVAHSKRNKQSREEPRSRPLGRMGRVEQPIPWDRDWQSALAGFRAMGDGIPRCVEATDAARNAIVPQVAQVFIECVMECQP
jgi:DNA (cytosine-5)-methyltransferase 1